MYWICLVLLHQEVIQLRLFLRTIQGIGVLSRRSCAGTTNFIVIHWPRQDIQAHSRHPNPFVASWNISPSLVAVPLLAQRRDGIVDRCNLGSCCCMHSDSSAPSHLLCCNGSQIWQRQAMLTEVINGLLSLALLLHCHRHIFFVHLDNSVKIRKTHHTTWIKGDGTWR